MIMLVMLMVIMMLVMKTIMMDKSNDFDHGDTDDDDQINKPDLRHVIPFP